MISFHTFGCKCNLYDSNSIAASLPDFIQVCEGELVAKIHVINTCTVTASADAQAKNLIRKLDKLNEGSVIFIIGCSSRKFFDVYQKLVDVLLINNKNKFVITDNFENNVAELILLKYGENNFSQLVKYNKVTQIFRTRAFLKISDGCDSYCSYCIIPFVRGRERSRTINYIIEEIKFLEESNIQEIVLSAINLGNYQYGLENLIESILTNTTVCRIRLSSLRPSKISERLIELMKNCRICPHLHLSLQSGSDKILKLMKRIDYKGDDFVKVTRRIETEFSERAPFIAADVIVGFPGETDDDFNRTYEVIKNSYLNKLHVFPFSPRPGTSACDMEKCNSQVVRERRDLLLELSNKLYLESLKKMQGRKINVLWEDGKKGITENYFPTVPAYNFETEINTIGAYTVVGVDEQNLTLICSL